MRRSRSPRATSSTASRSSPPPSSVPAPPSSATSRPVPSPATASLAAACQRDALLPRVAPCGNRQPVPERHDDDDLHLRRRTDSEQPVPPGGRSGRRTESRLRPTDQLGEQMRPMIITALRRALAAVWAVMVVSLVLLAAWSHVGVAHRPHRRIDGARRPGSGAVVGAGRRDPRIRRGWRHRHRDRPPTASSSPTASPAWSTSPKAGSSSSRATPTPRPDPAARPRPRDRRPSRRRTSPRRVRAGAALDAERARLGARRRSSCCSSASGCSRTSRMGPAARSHRATAKAPHGTPA